MSKEDQADLLHLLREVAYADSNDIFQKKLDDLLLSKVYKSNNSVQNYLQRMWLGCTTVSIYNYNNTTSVFTEKYCQDYFSFHGKSGT